MVLVMSVVPGEGGQAYIPESTDKIKNLKQYIEENHLDVDIEVDGGINDKTAELVRDAGADILVAGTAILVAKDYKVIIDELRA